MVAGACLLLLAVAARAFTPKLVARVAVNTLLGLGALLLLNATSRFTGLRLGLNLFNAVVVGILGIPGLGLLLLLSWVVT